MRSGADWKDMILCQCWQLRRKLAPDQNRKQIWLSTMDKFAELNFVASAIASSRHRE